jgi:hypothetical protein
VAQLLQYSPQTKDPSKKQALNETGLAFSRG